jgi:hypothetical protein
LNFSNTQLAGWLHRMTSHYIQAWGDPMIGQTAALLKLGEAAYREAQVQAFADAYLVIAVCFAISAMWYLPCAGSLQNRTMMAGDAVAVLAAIGLTL